MGWYDESITNTGGAIMYREAAEIYLDNGMFTSIARYDETDGEGITGYQGQIDKIEVRVRAPQLIDIRVEVSDGENTYVTETLYCGTFTVVWSS